MNTVGFTHEQWTEVFEDMDRREKIIDKFFPYVTRYSHATPQENYEAGWWVKKNILDLVDWIQYIPEEPIEEFEVLLVLREL